MNKRIIGLLLIIRALTPFILLFIIIFSGYLIINDLEQDLKLQIDIVRNSIINTKKSLDNVKGGISEITSSFAVVSSTLSSALKPIDDAFDTINSGLEKFGINGIGIDLNLSNIFDPLFTPLKNVKEGVDTLTKSIDEVFKPIKNSVSILQKDLIKWIQDMIILVIIIFLLLLNYFVSPLISNMKEGIELLFNRRDVGK
ncbi:hypothetical protein IQ276_025475 [Desmonostoc muscorum LEGE 12446]|uniref:Uncharacterized protein n=1 Tax=Desmonostoc muscorum LEGE 12446 TaxID=1828758 RepID=A0A8J7CZV3_DESMC|nr:hypothetical protein [Desmonostoc muscorum]MCF2149721.1 hypothetical protein [Desmonostoc muscorum LEGE 12446]